MNWQCFDTMLLWTSLYDMDPYSPEIHQLGLSFTVMLQSLHTLWFDNNGFCSQRSIPFFLSFYSFLLLLCALSLRLLFVYSPAITSTCYIVNYGTILSHFDICYPFFPSLLLFSVPLNVTDLAVISP